MTWLYVPALQYRTYLYLVLTFNMSVWLSSIPSVCSSCVFGVYRTRAISNRSVGTTDPSFILYSLTWLDELLKPSYKPRVKSIETAVTDWTGKVRTGSETHMPIIFDQDGFTSPKPPHLICILGEEREFINDVFRQVFDPCILLFNNITSYLDDPC